jgi:hypothetical protein
VNETFLPKKSGGMSTIQWSPRLRAELRILKQTDTIPFKYEIGFPNGEDAFVAAFLSRKECTAFFDVTIAKENAPLLNRDYISRLTFVFSHDYPDTPPQVMHDGALALRHEFLRKDGKLDLNDYTTAMTIFNIISDTYCLLLEALQSNVNRALIYEWNTGWSRDCHNSYRELVLALAPLNLPSYVLLWILDWLPQFGPKPEIKKIRLIDGIYRCLLERKH